MQPRTIQQSFDLALQQHRDGKFDEAERLYRQILAHQPDHAGALHFLGLLAYQQGRNRIAIALMRRSIEIAPNFPEAYSNLGAALGVKGSTDEAIAAYRQALALRPDLPGAHNNLGTALIRKGQLDEGIAAYRQAIALNPAHGAAYSNLGKALKDAGELDAAIAAFTTALSIKPTDVAAHSNLLCALHFHPAYDAKSIADELGRWNLRHAKPLLKSVQPHSNDPNPDRRLRIGYVSPDFREHCQARFTVPLLRAHDHTHFEIFCYSDVARPDAMTEQLRQHADVWTNIARRSDEEVVDRIRQDRIDILVDLTMHMAGSRLLVFARKPAPVQVCWLAYPGSTGLTAIDYRLTDPFLDPPGVDESVYSEKTVRLRDSFWCYEPNEGREIPVSPLPALGNGFITFGSLNNFGKVNDGVLATWAAALRQVRGSRLVLLTYEGAHRQRTLDRLEKEGIAPERIQFFGLCPRRDYLALYNQIDISLDTFPYNGHTTSLDSFWMGVPVISLVGKTVVGRAGLCQLSRLGLTEFAAESREQFVLAAMALGGDLPKLQMLRASLRQRLSQSPLMDAPRFARNIEAAYRRMWQTWCTPVADFI